MLTYQSSRDVTESEMAVLKSVLCTQPCSSHPEGGTHECLEAEMRCSYCGVRLAPYPCNGCGRFLTAKQMHTAETTDGIWRCEDCQ